MHFRPLRLFLSQKTMQTLMKYTRMRYFIVVFSVCQSTCLLISGMKRVVLKWITIRCFNRLPVVMWLLVFYVSSSRCRGLVCSVWLRHFLTICIYLSNPDWLTKLQCETLRHNKLFPRRMYVVVIKFGHLSWSEVNIVQNCTIVFKLVYIFLTNIAHKLSHKHSYNTLVLISVFVKFLPAYVVNWLLCE